MERDLDKKLYNDYLSGEKQAFEYLYNKYKNKIEYFIYNIVKDYQKSEDLAQETFIYIMQNEMKSEVSFKYYIYLIAKSKALNYINVENRRNEIAEAYLTNNEQVEKDVLDVITQEETNKELLESIELLDERYKNAVYLVNIENLSYKETADILDETLQNTKNLVHRGKKQLRKILLKKGFDEMNKVSKVLIIILGTTILLTGATFAGVAIYNQFIKQEDKIETRGLFDTGDGITTYEIDLMANDMTWNEETRLYHRIITNIEDYNKYKSRINKLPDMEEKDFDENFLIIIANENKRDIDESDLKISDVYAKEDITYIILKQKEMPDYSNQGNVWYAVVDKSQLKENIKVEIEHKIISNDNFTELDKLPNDYSIQDAINDGCFVVDKNKVVSPSKGKLDEFITKTEKGENNFIRVYSKYDENVTIKDVEYNNGIYYVDTIQIRLEEKQKLHNSYKKVEKYVYKDNGGTSYVFKTEPNSMDGYPFVTINE